MRLLVTVGADSWPVEISEREGGYRVRLGEEWLEVDGRLKPTGPCALLLGGVPYLADVEGEGEEMAVTIRGATYRVRVEEPGRRLGRATRTGSGGAGQRLVAPMPGRVVAVLVAAGDRVEPGAPLLVLEAMKMENEFRATAAGVISEMRVEVGQAVNAGDLLLVVTEPG